MNNETISNASGLVQSCDPGHGNSAPALSEQLRESLSALLDGELNTTEAAFLIKRMAHDQALNAQWQRFHGIGEVLRGQAEHIDADNFSARVLRKIEADRAQSTQGEPARLVTSDGNGRQRLRRYGTGLAIAAAVAWAALLLPQQIARPPSAPKIADVAAPLTIASPIVGMHAVSEHSGSGLNAGSYENDALLAQSMEAFLLQHVQGVPISPNSDAVYLQAFASR
jgi:negative regulator of sigma E activity